MASPKYSLLLFIGFSIIAEAQTINDSIENRIEIFPETAINSQTNGNTVQWNCVDEKLTGKCIKYHNDQWFYFTALNAAVQYINISKQDCRDIWGVQLVVIEGTPCQTESYQIKTCISLGTQDDIFAVLDNLEAGKEYLLNVDGYLHDYCTFEMELSLVPKGLPAEQSILLEASDYVKDDTLNYTWVTPDSLLALVTKYSLYKRKAGEFRFSLVKEFQAKQDAYGESLREYKYVEVLNGEDDPWVYKLTADVDGLTHLVDEFSAQANWLNKVKKRYRIQPELNYGKKAKLEIVLKAYVQNITLEKIAIEYFPRDFRPIVFEVTDYIDLGVTRFLVEIKNVSTGKSEFINYQYTEGIGIERMK